MNTLAMARGENQPIQNEYLKQQKRRDQLVQNMATEDQPPSPSDICYSQFSVDAKHSSTDHEKSAICQWCRKHCVKGYFWACIGGLCFFVVLPAGILLVIHGHNNGMALTLCLGVLVLVVAICVFPGAYIGLHHWRRQRRRRERLRRVAMDAIKEQASFVNNSALISPNDSLRVLEV